jgi:predicted RNA methylase
MSTRTARRGLIKRIEHGYLKPWLRRLGPYVRRLESWHVKSFAGVRVHYQPYLDGGGTTFRQEIVPYLRARGMPKQARAFEWCAGPGFIGFSLLGHGLCETLCLADINGAAVKACQRTIADNGLEDRVAVYRSDNLRDIPPSEQWDLVVSNPPHCIDVAVGDRRTHDPDWSVHRGFFADVGRFLKPGGVIVLQEANNCSTAETFRPMIEEAGLAIVFVDYCAPERTVDVRYYYIGIMRAGETPPRWARPRRV